ncbi:hypothetical protein Ahy_A07g032408 [Arachis hypogaea]|uniref:Uncharacterized protein n=1 Tax=Arachis hypogaea TaxID=3818 RepID=A0A445C6V8_ARAHY|nr:hypothetical protein Ahy_A07g032408 [Arachis hypogaea]
MFDIHGRIMAEQVMKFSAEVGDVGGGRSGQSNFVQNDPPLAPPLLHVVEDMDADGGIPTKSMLRIAMTVVVQKTIRASVFVVEELEPFEGWSQDPFRVQLTAVDKKKENQNPNAAANPEEEKHKTKKPTPISLIRGFASLSVQDGNSQIRGIEGVPRRGETQEGERREKEDGADSMERFEKRGKEGTIDAENSIQLNTEECRVLSSKTNNTNESSKGILADPIDVRILEAELEDELVSEERFWREKSRVQWLKWGDKNTKFFHSKYKARNRRNKIHHLEDEEGNIAEDAEGIANMAQHYFTKLFTSSNPRDPAGEIADSSYAPVRVSELILPTRQWNQTKIRQFFSTDIAESILNTTIHEGEDSVTWMKEKNGGYSVASGYRWRWWVNTMEKVKSNAESNEKLELVANLLWQLWKARNELVFEGVRRSPSLSVELAQTMIIERKRTT